MRPRSRAWRTGPLLKGFFFIRDRFAFEKCEDGRSYCLVVCMYFAEFTLRRKFLPKFAPTTTTLDIGTIAQKQSRHDDVPIMTSL